MDEVGPVCSAERCYRIKTDGEGYPLEGQEVKWVFQ